VNRFFSMRINRNSRPMFAKASDFFRGIPIVDVIKANAARLAVLVAILAATNALTILPTCTFALLFAPAQWASYPATGDFSKGVAEGLSNLFTVLTYDWSDKWTHTPICLLQLHESKLPNT
jgi:hypothetical protein